MGDNAPMLKLNKADAAMLLASALDSFALDFVARSAIGGMHLSYFIMKQLPVPPPEQFDAELYPGETYAAFIRPRALELTYTAWDLQPLAQDLGYAGPPFRWDPVRRFLLRCELEAAFFHLYGLDADDVGYIMDTFPGVARAEIQEYGEYRTRRAILEIHAAITDARRRDRPYPTRLYPGPANPAAAHPAEHP